MSCCNKAPNGGSRQLEVLLKLTLGMFIGLALMSVLFG